MAFYIVLISAVGTLITGFFNLQPQIFAIAAMLFTTAYIVLLIEERVKR